MTDEDRSHDQEFVEYVVKSIVDHPDDVMVARSIDEMGVLLTLTVNPDDMGQVIGRQGGTAKSIRTLLRVIGAKNNARVNLKINEPEGSSAPQRSERSEAPQLAETPQQSVGNEAPQLAETPQQSVDEAIDDLNL